MPTITISKQITLPLPNPQPIVKIALDEVAVERAKQEEQMADPDGASKQHEMIDKQKVLHVLNSGQLDSFQVKQDQNGTTVTFTVKKPGILRGQEQQPQAPAPAQPAQPMQTAAAKKDKKKATEKAKKGGDDWNPNPWAVCHTTVDKDKNPEKFERCVMDVKKKQSSSESSMEVEAKKKKKSKDYNPNPWAVCHTTVDKDADPEKYERCVMDVKKKQASYSSEFLNSMGLKIASENETEA